MASAIPQEELAEIVRDARARTGVPAVAAGSSSAGGWSSPPTGRSRSRPRSGSRRSRSGSRRRSPRSCLDLDEPGRARPGSRTPPGSGRSPREPLPEACRGLWSYSNAGYWAAGEACDAATGLSFSDAMRERMLEPLGLDAHELRGAGRRRPGSRAGGRDGSPARGAGGVSGVAARRPAGSGRRSATCSALRVISSEGPGPLSASAAERRCASRGPRRSAPATASAAGGGSSQAGGSRSTTRDPSAATSRCSCSFRRRRRRSRCSRTAGAAAASSGGSSGARARACASAEQATGSRFDAAPPATSSTDWRRVVERRGGRCAWPRAETDPVTGARIERAPYPVERARPGCLRLRRRRCS